MKRLMKLNRLLVLLALLAVGMTWRIPEAAADHCSRGEGIALGTRHQRKGPIRQGQVAGKRLLPAP
jgi:hypothetical protein